MKSTHRGNGNPDDLEELRQLLLGDDLQKLEEVHTHVEVPENFSRQVGEVLPQALIRSSEQGEALSEAMVPTVEEIVRLSIKKEMASPSHWRRPSSLRFVEDAQELGVEMSDGGSRESGEHFGRDVGRPRAHQHALDGHRAYLTGQSPSKKCFSRGLMGAGRGPAPWYACAQWSRRYTPTTTPRICVLRQSFFGIRIGAMSLLAG